MTARIIPFLEKISSKRLVIILFICVGLMAVAVSIQNYFLPQKVFDTSGNYYTHYNNYTIFRNSFYHLVEGKDLYALYPKEQWDLYKYSPTFAIIFGFFALLPDLAGLITWNLLNCLAFLLALTYLPFSKRNIIQIVLISAVELVGATQNIQSNALIAGLLIGGFALAERGRTGIGVLLVVFSGFIKIYSLTGLAIFLFYPKRIKSITYTITWICLLTILPLTVVSPQHLLMLYKSWYTMLRNDEAISLGLSIMGIMDTWLHAAYLKLYIEMACSVLFLVLMFRGIKLHNNLRYRLLMLSFILISIVVFNHKAESPTYIIPVAGIAIWFYASPRNKLNIILLVLCLVLTSLSVTNIFPRDIRNGVVVPYDIKTLLPFIIWCKVIADTMRLRVEKKENDIESAGRIDSGDIEGLVTKPLG